MKFLIILFLLLLSSCADKKEQEKIVELQNIISSVEKQDFSIFDELFDTSQLSPYKYIGDFEHIKDEKTNYISHTHKGKIIAYTNQYGMVFFNDEEILHTLEDIQKVPYAIMIADNFFTGATNRYNEIIEYILTLTNVDFIVQTYRESLTYEKDNPLLSKVMYTMGIEYSWVKTYFYYTPDLYHENKILWFTDEFNSILNDELESRILYNLLKDTENPSISFINGWLYFILYSFYHPDGEDKYRLLMMDEVPSK